MMDGGHGRGKNIVVPIGAPSAGGGATGRASGVYSGVQVFGKKYPTYWFTDQLVQYPTLAAIVFASLPFVLALFVLMVPIYVDRGVTGFQLTDHETFKNKELLTDAQSKWQEARSYYIITRSTRDAGGLASTTNMPLERYLPLYRIYISYTVHIENALATRPDENTSVVLNLFDPDHLEWIRRIEERISTLPYYTQLMWLNNAKEAGAVANGSYFYPPLNSALTYFYIGNVQKYSSSSAEDAKTWWNWEFMGRDGTQQTPISSVLKTFFRNENYRWFVDGRASPHLLETTALRTQLTLGAPRYDPRGTEYSTARMNDDVDAFLLNLRDVLEGPLTEHPYIEVTYGGDRIQEMIIMDLLKNDSIYPSLSVLFVILFMWIHTNSIILSLATVVQLLIISPAGLFLYNRLTGHHEVSLLSSLVVFVIFSFGLDSAMIMFSTFNHSGFMATMGRINTLTVEQRIAYTYRKSGVGITISNIVALSCFAVNSISPVRAIQNFGIQMVIMCVLNLYMFLTFFPSMLLVHHFHFSKRRRNLQRKKEILLSRTQRVREPNLRELLSAESEVDAILNLPTYKQIREYRDDATVQEIKERATQKGVVEWALHHLPVRNLANPFKKGRRALESEARNATQARFGEDLEMMPQPPEQIASQQENLRVNVEETPAPEFDMNAFADASQIANYSTAGGKLRNAEQLLLDFKRKPQRNNVMQVPVCPEFWRKLSAEAQSLEVSTEVSEAENEKWRIVGSHLDITHNTADGLDENGNMLPSTVRLGAFTRSCYDIYRGATFVTGALTDHNNGDMGQGAPNTQGTALANGAFLDGADVAQSMGAEVSAPAMDQDAHMGSPTRGGAATAKEQQRDIRRKRAKRWQVHRRIADWWDERGQIERRWCCGRFGQRVNETQEERERRILAKRVKHEGYTRMERFFLSYIAEYVYRYRHVVALLWLGVFVTFAIFASKLEPTAKGQTILGDNPSEKFDLIVEGHYTVGGTCDYCAAYYRPRTNFPTVNPDAVAACESQRAGYGKQMFATMDYCGICEGKNECVDCEGKPFGTKKLDNCNQCLSSSNDERWNICDKECTDPTNLVGKCSYCYRYLGKPVYYYGRDTTGTSCTIFCNTNVCPSDRGTCNPYTGECVCHQDYSSGFFVNDDSLVAATIPGEQRQYCTKCLQGFFPNPGANVERPCSMECDSSSGGPRCECDLRGRCNCPGALIGSNCETPWTAKCQNGGQIDPTTGACTCLPDWADNSTCSSSAACNFHGILHSSSVVPAGMGGCQCYGYWRGPQCTMCACRNGGTCDKSGTCICTGSWTGLDCNQCDETCSKHGSCPAAWTIENYANNLSTCKAIYCTASELRLMIPSTTNCKRCHEKYQSATCAALPSLTQTSAPTTAPNGTNSTAAPPTPTPTPTALVNTTNSTVNSTNSTGGNSTNSTETPQPTTLTCESSPLCYWSTDDTKCYDVLQYAAPTPHQFNCNNCSGAWSGTTCEICTAGANLRCREPDGVVVGCDNQPVNSIGEYAYVDQCGICGGSNLCPGCDGIPNSLKTLDKCGVCGGFNECLEANGNTSLGRATATIRLVFGLKEDLSKIDFANSDVQQHLLWVCDQLNGREDIIVQTKSRCWWAAFAKWLNTPENAEKYGLPNMLFPYEDHVNFKRALYYYMEDTQNYDLIGFNNANPNAKGFAIEWFAFELRTSNVFKDASLSDLESAYDFWTVILNNVNTPTWYKIPVRLKAFMVCDEWVSLFTRLHSIAGATYTTTVGGLLTVLVVLVVSCSLTLTLLTTCTIASSVLMALGVMYLVGWELGPIEQIAMSLLLGVCAEQTLQILEGYMEYLHSAQSHILARDTTRLQAYRGMLLRAGIPVTFSMLAMVTISLLQLGSELYVFRKVAYVVMIVVLVSSFNNVIFLGGLIGLAGPVVSYRSMTMMFVVAVNVIIFGTFVVVFLLYGVGLKDVEGDRIAG